MRCVASRLLMCCLLVYCSWTAGYGQEPFVRSFVRHVATWGERGNGPVQFRDPEGISAGPDGFLYVADTGNNRIQKLSASGAFVTEMGGFGWEKEQFDGPVALSARNGLDVFVADHNNGRIERYDKDLHYLGSLGASEEWAEHLRFGFPLGADISSQGELFCLDGENRRVLKLDVLGTPQIAFGDFDAGEGRLVEPQRVLVPGDGRVYVSDTDDKRVAVFDVHGNYLFSFGTRILNRPMGMARHGSFLLVADAEKRKVLIFRGAEHVGNIGGVGILFEEPADVAVWRNRVYILDRRRCVIDVFQWIDDEKTTF